MMALCFAYVLTHLAPKVDGFKNMPTYVPSTMFDHPNAHKTSKTHLQDTIPLALVLII
jgi:hypothetical protein